MPKKLITAAILMSSTLQAQDFNSAKLDSFFTAVSANNKGMGCMAIFKDNQPLYQRAIGYAAVLDSRAIKADQYTKYRIGSITKTFTATMILQLVEEKKLTLDTKLDKFFPEIANAKTITIAQMLNHHSGIHNITDDSLYMTYHTLPKTQAQMVAIIAAAKSDFTPGSNASYSNSAYILLGYILEKLTGKPYKDLLQERICKKAELYYTYAGGPVDINKNEAISYNFSCGDFKKEPETDMSIPAGAGCIVSTPADLNRFMYALMNEKLIGKEMLAKMKEMHEGYGFGLVTFPFGAKKAYGHTGGVDGFVSMTGYIPEDKLAVSYVANSVSYSVNDIMIAGLSAYYKQPYAVPKFAMVTVPKETLETYCGTYATPLAPMKIRVFLDGCALMAQATGQSEFPLEAESQTKFKFDMARLTVEFDVSKKQMVLNQGMPVTFTKEN